MSSSNIEHLKKQTIPIVIFGSSSVGEAIYFECVDKGIDVACFCDNSSSKTGEIKFGLHILHPTELLKKYPEALIIISVADIKDIVLQLKGLNYSNWMAGGLLLKEFEIAKHEFNGTFEYVDYAISTAVLCHEGFVNRDKLYLRSVDIVITEKCSLKCESCSNLSQYYVNPKNDDIAGLSSEIDALCANIDEINEFRVIGGEPFMNKNIHLVVEKIIQKKNVRKIVIFTNGTIVPTKNQLKIFQNEKVLFVITDYGKLSKNTQKMVDLCKEYKVGYYCEEVSGWTECSTIHKHNRTQKEQESVFMRCCAKNLITISNGKLYRCPFIANAHRLNAMPKYETDYVDVTSDAPDLKAQINDFLLNRTYLDGCDFCQGRFLDAPEIKPAIQVKKPIEYKEYK